MKSTPYIDIPLVCYEDSNVNYVEEIFKNYLYINLNTICQEESCINEDESIVNWYIKKYEVLEMPRILSFNTNINDYNTLISYESFINKLFIENIKIYNNNYKWIAFVTQPEPNHFIGYFQNYYDRFPSSLLKWYKFDDRKGCYKELKKYRNKFT